MRAGRVRLVSFVACLGIAVSAFYLLMSLPLAHLARRLERRLQHRHDSEASPVEVLA